MSDPSLTGLDLTAEGFARSQNMLLPNKFIQRARPHTVGERSAAITGRSGRTGLKTDSYSRRWHDASYNAMEQAVAALSDSTRDVGMVTELEHASKSGETPRPSLPTMRAQLLLNEKRETATSPVGLRAARLQLNSRARDRNSEGGTASRTGTRNREPARRASTCCWKAGPTAPGEDAQRPQTLRRSERSFRHCQDPERRPGPPPARVERESPAIAKDGVGPGP